MQQTQHLKRFGYVFGDHILRFMLREVRCMSWNWLKTTRPWVWGGCSPGKPLLSLLFLGDCFPHRDKRGYGSWLRHPRTCIPTDEVTSSPPPRLSCRWRIYQVGPTATAPPQAAFLKCLGPLLSWAPLVRARSQGFSHLAARLLWWAKELEASLSLPTATPPRPLI